MDQIRRILKDYYDIDMMNVLPQQGGWASLAFKVCDNNQTYFLKIYEKSRASTPKWTALIDQYVPIVVWLMQNSSLKGKIPTPFKTNSGEYKCEDEYGVYLLYDYIDGETIGEQDLTNNQIQQFSKIITELHSYGEDIPIRTDVIKEDFDVPFLQPLQHVLHQRDRDIPIEVRELINPYIKQINHLVHTIEELSQSLKKSNLRLALCHTDLHYWNLMKTGQQLVLIDWEGLKLAPVEADLMFLVDKAYFKAFLKIYRNTHKNFEINFDALMFYQARRRLEDIWEFIEQLLYDKQEELERIETMNLLQKELNGLREKHR